MLLLLLLTDFLQDRVSLRLAVSWACRCIAVSLWKAIYIAAWLINEFGVHQERDRASLVAWVCFSMETISDLRGGDFALPDLDEGVCGCILTLAQLCPLPLLVETSATCFTWCIL